MLAECFFLVPTQDAEADEAPTTADACGPIAFVTARRSDGGPRAQLELLAPLTGTTTRRRNVGAPKPDCHDL